MSQANLIQSRFSFAKGFTLLEVLVVLFIAAISLGAIGLAVGQISQGRQLDLEAESLISWIELSRRIAVIRHDTLAINYDEKENHLLLQQYKDQEWKQADVDQYKYALPKELLIKFTFSQDRDTKFRLFPDASYTPFSIELKESDDSLIDIQGDGFNPPETKQQINEEQLS